MGDDDGPAVARRPVESRAVIEQHDPFVAPADEEPTILGPLAQRDPNAPLDESAEYAVTGAASFDEVLRRARR